MCAFDCLAQLPTCASAHETCAECFFTYMELQIREAGLLRWDDEKQRATVRCFGDDGGGKCPALLGDMGFYKMLSSELRGVYVVVNDDGGCGGLRGT